MSRWIASYFYLTDQVTFCECVVANNPLVTRKVAAATEGGIKSKLFNQREEDFR